MLDTDKAERPITAADAKRDTWAKARREIERSSYWIGPDGPRARWRMRVFHIALTLFALGLKTVGLYRNWRQNALTPELVERQLRFANLPYAFDGYRILHVSDTHLDVLPELAPAARDMLAGVEIDLLVFTGDALGMPHVPLPAATRPLAEALEGLSPRDGRLAVLGNHDPAEMREALEAIGFRVLLNETVVLEKRGARLFITGLDDVHSFYTKAAHAALMDDPGGFRIALIHSPELADYAAPAHVALYLCGHTHGGQLCLPGGRPLITRLTRCRDAASGLWRQGATLGYTSRGLGSSWPPVRLNCRPEATIITLRTARAEGETPEPEPRD